MSLAKPEVAVSDFIDSKKPSAVDGRGVARKAYKVAVNRTNTAYTLWLLVVKHKFPLLAIGNVLLVANWVVPQWPHIVLGLLGR